jgi:hypothetical protein
VISRTTSATPRAAMSRSVVGSGVTGWSLS